MHLLTSTEETADPRVAPQVLGGLLQEVLVLLQQVHRREVLQETGDISMRHVAVDKMNLVMLMKGTSTTT